MENLLLLTKLFSQLQNHPEHHEELAQITNDFMIAEIIKETDEEYYNKICKKIGNQLVK